MAVLCKVATDDCPNHAFISFGILADDSRFEEEQDSPSGIFVGIVLATDLVDNVMAECHVSKSSGWAGRAKPPIVVLQLQQVLDLLDNSEMVGIGLPVYEVSPVEVAAGSPFASCKRSEYNQARVMRRVPSDFL
jgi:hypothetical protein